MTKAVFCHGEVMSAESAKVSPFDRGFLYGDSVYEVMRTLQQKPVELARHIERLHQSCKKLSIPLIATDVIASAIEKTLHAVGAQESYIRVIVTRGGDAGSPITLGFATATPELLVLVTELAPRLPSAEQFAKGVFVWPVKTIRTPKTALDPAAKTGNYLNNIMALQESAQAGAYECLMSNEQGNVAEGSSSNFFWVKQGELFTPTPGSGILCGITRRRVLELAMGHSIRCHEVERPLSDAMAADEWFLTSSLRGILPVSRLGDQSRAPGPITQKLCTAYDEFLRTLH